MTQSINKKYNNIQFKTNNIKIKFFDIHNTPTNISYNL